MKMKLYDRLTLLIGGAVTLLAGIFSFIGAIVLFKYCTYESVLLDVLPYLLLVFGIFSCAAGVFNILLPQRYHPHRRAFISQHTEHGEMRIAVSAVENLILRCVETHKEVKVLNMQVNNRRGAVSVNLCVTVNSNISIPHAVEQIQTQIKRYLAASSGIELREVGVSVERTEGDELDLPVEPLAHAAEMLAGAQVMQEQEEVAMHQRVFGRDTSKSMAEQVTEAETIEMLEEVEPETAEEEPENAEVEACEPEISEEPEELPAEPAEELPDEEPLAEAAETEACECEETEEAQALPELPELPTEEETEIVAEESFEDDETAEENEPAESDDDAEAQE